MAARRTVTEVFVSASCGLQPHYGGPGTRLTPGSENSLVKY